MKAIILSLIFVLGFYAANSADQTVGLDLRDVKIYLSGAELTHTAKLKLKQGINIFLLENIADKIKPNSMNAFISGKADIMEISEKYDYLASPDNSANVNILDDSLRLVNNKIDELNIQIKALESQAEILEANKTISGMDKVMTVADLKQMTEYYYQANLINSNEKLRINREIKRLQNIASNLQKQMQEMNTIKKKPAHRIYISISSKSAQTIDLMVKYIINEAGWVPGYDIRVENTDSPVSFWHKASVHQNSGLEFKDINLTLSTREPLEFGDMPHPQPRYLSMPVRNRRGWFSGGGNGSESDPLNPSSAGSGDSWTEYVPENESVPDNFTQNSNSLASSLSTEFATDLKYTIPSDNKMHYVDLKASEVEGTFEYYAAPDIRQEAYLITRISNWEDQRLLPGDANVYFENSFIGATKINPAVTLDTLSVSLGVDKNVIIEREVIRDFTESKFLSSDVERFFAYKITIRNNRKARIKIDVEEIIPVTKNDDITVELIETSGGNFDEEKGFLRWKMDIEPGAKVEKILKYSVRYPAGKVIYGL